MCFVFAACKDGTDPDAQRQASGQVDPGSVTSPGTAQSGISVGASESRRPEFKARTCDRWWQQDLSLAAVRVQP